EQLRAATSIKVIFHGPDSYISPAWYIESKDNVPTWNYSVVHCSGDFEIISEPKAALKDMQAVIAEFEQRYGTNWSLATADENDRPNVDSSSVHKDVTAMLPHIVVFRFKNLKLDAKFKLSQKLDKVSRETTIAELKALGEEKTDSTLFDLAEYMELTRS
ncbi:MAG: FMN-binding negative transcriptional regulator, partial [Bdellovibrionota bacterium]